MADESLLSRLGAADADLPTVCCPKSKVHVLMTDRSSFPCIELSLQDPL